MSQRVVAGCGCGNAGFHLRNVSYKPFPMPCSHIQGVWRTDEIRRRKPSPQVSDCVLGRAMSSLVVL